MSGFRAALDLNTYPLRNLIRPRCAERAKPGRGKPVLIMHIGFLACFHAISLERSRFSKIATFNFLALVALKLLVSLMSHSRRQTDRQTEDTQNDYCNPRCACAPRVSNGPDRSTTALGAGDGREAKNHCLGSLGPATSLGSRPSPYVRVLIARGWAYLSSPARPGPWDDSSREA